MQLHTKGEAGHDCLGLGLGLGLGGAAALACLAPSVDDDPRHHARHGKRRHHANDGPNEGGPAGRRVRGDVGALVCV